MGQLTIKEVEQKVTASGKELKKVVLSEEGREWDYKGVTVWSDHPEYDAVVVGAVLTDSHVNAQPSTVPNPHKEGTFYNKYTLYKGAKQENQAQSKSATDDKLTAIYGLLKDLCKHQGMVSIQETPNNSTQEQIDANYGIVDDINVEEIPFN